MDYEFDLQLFGAGEVVNGTDAYINAAEGTREAYNG